MRKPFARVDSATGAPSVEQRAFLAGQFHADVQHHLRKTVEEQSEANRRLPASDPALAGDDTRAAPIPQSGFRAGRFYEDVSGEAGRVRSMAQRRCYRLLRAAITAERGTGFFYSNVLHSSPEKTPLEDPLKSLRPEPIPASNFQFSAPLRSPEPSAQGGFTQLLQALNKEQPIPYTQRNPLAAPTRRRSKSGGWRIYAASADPLCRTCSQQAPAAASCPNAAGSRHRLRGRSRRVYADYFRLGAARFARAVLGLFLPWPGLGRPTSFRTDALSSATHMPPMPQISRTLGRLLHRPCRILRRRPFHFHRRPRRQPLRLRRRARCSNTCP